MVLHSGPDIVQCLHYLCPFRPCATPDVCGEICGMHMRDRVTDGLQDALHLCNLHGIFSTLRESQLDAFGDALNVTVKGRDLTS